MAGCRFSAVMLPCSPMEPRATSFADLPRMAIFRLPLTYPPIRPRIFNRLRFSFTGTVRTMSTFTAAIAAFVKPEGLAS